MAVSSTPFALILPVDIHLHAFLLPRFRLIRLMTTAYLLRIPPSNAEILFKAGSKNETRGRITLDMIAKEGEFIMYLYLWGMLYVASQ